MTRMLMAAAHEGSHSSPKDPEDGPRYQRTAQRMRERRQWMQEQEMPYYWQPSADTYADYESDCRHGCNGDCFISGSDRCTANCH